MSAEIKSATLRWQNERTNSSFFLITHYNTFCLFPRLPLGLRAHSSHGHLPSLEGFLCWEAFPLDLLGGELRDVEVVDLREGLQLRPAGDAPVAGQLHGADDLVLGEELLEVAVDGDERVKR